MKKPVAIVGASGQIGTVICREWLRSPDIRPVAIVRNRLAEAVLRARFGPILEIRRGAVAEPRDAIRLLGDCGNVINCSYASAGGFRASRLANEAVISSILGVSGVTRLVHLSSVAVYGDGRQSTFDRPKPRSSYGREKIRHEAFAVAAVKSARERLTILRVGHVYGAEQVMSRFILESISDPRFRLPHSDGEGSNCVSLRSLVRGLEMAVLSAGTCGIYNLVDAPNRLWRDIFSWHADAVSLPLPARLTSEQTESVERAFVGNGLADVMKEAMRAMRPAGLGRLAASPSVRSRIDSFFSGGPAFLESIARNIHLTDSVSSQLSQVDLEFTPLPEWMFFRKIPGPSLLPDTPTADVSDCSLVQAWWRSVTIPRWND